MFKPALLKSAIENTHSADNPVVFDLSVKLSTFADEISESLRIGAMMLRDMHDNKKTKDRSFKTVIIISTCVRYCCYVNITHSHYWYMRAHD